MRPYCGIDLNNNDSVVSVVDDEERIWEKGTYLSDFRDLPELAVPFFALKKRCRYTKRAKAWLERVAYYHPGLFAHWQFGFGFTAG